MCYSRGMISDRYLKEELKNILPLRMAFVGGPRQVGKTTLALSFLKPPTVKNPNYLNWDAVSARKTLQAGHLPPNSKRVVIDEIHKNRQWRNLIKGLFDTNRGECEFIVTGSARLDHFRKGGDSLFGRYRYLRLHPFSINELSRKATPNDLQDLITYGGFPEPLFKADDKFYRLWKRERLERVVFTDVRDLENIQDLNKMELLVEALPARVGSPLSIENLRQDLDTSHPTLKRWLEILDSLYFSFRISPLGAPKIRAVKKEQKLYLWDWASVEDPGVRFENFVASHLLKYCHFTEDTEGHHMELRFLRDRDLREIDFVVLKNKKPLFAVECKSGDRSLSKNILYFKERMQIPEFYQVHLGKNDFGNAKTTGRCLPFLKFCQELNLP
jgi:predicted AAA+ superfamily ATPase